MLGGEGLRKHVFPDTGESSVREPSDCHCVSGGFLTWGQGGAKLQGWSQGGHEGAAASPCL